MIPTDDEIKQAVRDACRGRQVSPEDRFDLQQDLALKLLEHNEPEKRSGWIRTVARNLVSDFVKEQALHRELDQAYIEAPNRAPKGSLTKDPMVNYITVHPAAHGNGINRLEDDVIAWVDSRARAGTGPKLVPTCVQDQVAEKRTTSYLNRFVMQKPYRKTRAGSSSL